MTDRIPTDVSGVAPFDSTTLEVASSRPDLAYDVDLAAHVAACPEGATTRGTFFRHIRDFVRQRAPERIGESHDELFSRDWVPLQNYPLADFLRLAHAAARLVYPDRHTADALRRIGWLAYPAFASTTVGRIVLFAMGHELEDVVKVSATAYRVALPGSVVRATWLGVHHYSIEMRSVYCFADSYQYGVIEGVTLSFGKTPRVTMRSTGRLCDADFDVQW